MSSLGNATIFRAIIIWILLFVVPVRLFDPTCPPGINQCGNQSKVVTISKTRSKSIGWNDGMLSPLPPIQSAYGVPVGEFNGELDYYIDQDESNSTFKPFIDSTSLLPAGHRCTSSHQCSNELSCELLNDIVQSNGPLLSIAKLNQSLASESSELSVCSRVQCDSDCFNSKSKPIQCPTDSYILEYESEDQRCCIQTCKCLSNKCNNCTFGYNIIHRGNLQQPGNCCDRIQCVDGPNSLPKSIKPPFYCIHNDKQYKHGEKWHSTDCNQCQCRDGVAVCNKINNCSLIHGCYSNSEEKKQLNDDECCSECKGCFLHQIYHRHNTSWTQDDDCETCTCINASQLFMYIIISSITVLVVVSIGIIYFILCLHTPGDTPVPKDTVKYNTVQTDENHDIYLTNNQVIFDATIQPNSNSIEQSLRHEP
ncbi:hypothetical protein RDWZM_009732 [Blomia tropicalis]|uniref:VWFC domain-containing protein n=1 Tax=Blomia tropicalis TaxID=40697 RepID=A0A9Q0RLL0_BLOTA|nr:hypothetical protein RDWZM_009732 [Blomia tropicalis]